MSGVFVLTEERLEPDSLCYQGEDETKDRVNKARSEAEFIQKQGRIIIISAR